MTKSIQQQRNEIVLQRLLKESNDSDEDAEFIAENLEWMLDEMASKDYFGTERQRDPRGDCRDGDDYTMWNVMGVD